MRAYHKSHISKTIVIDLLGLYFEDILEIGGRATNLFSKDLKVPKLDREKLLVIMVL